MSPDRRDASCSTPPVGADRMLFVHVPRTAGTTLMQDHFGSWLSERERFLLRGRPEHNSVDLATFHALADETRQSYRLVAGYNAHRLADVYGADVTTAVVREPAAQIRSTYFSAIQTGGDSPEYWQIDEQGLTLAAYIRESWNPQLRALSGEGVEDVERTLDRYDLIGCYEALDRYVFLLWLIHDVPLSTFGRLLPGPHGNYKMSRRERRLVRAHNPIDVELYDRARHRFEEIWADAVGPLESAAFTRYAAELREARPTGPPATKPSSVASPELAEPVGRAESKRRTSDRNVDVAAIGPTVKVTEPPRVSFVTTCFRSRDFMVRCLDGVAAQTYANVEHIVQDAASEDGTVELLAAARHDIDWRSEPDSGESEGLNRALQRVRGDYFLVLNADDAILPHAAQWCVDQFAKHPDAGAIFGDQYLVDVNDEVIGLVFGPDNCTYEGILCGEQVPPAQASFIRTDAMREVGMYADESLDTCPDHEMWIRLGAEFELIHEPGLITWYRYHSDGKGRQSAIVDQMVRDKSTVNQRVWDDPSVADEIKALERRARSSMSMWGAAMCIDAGDTPKAIRYGLRAMRPWPNGVWRDKLLKSVGHWRYRRERLNYLETAA